MPFDLTHPHAHPCTQARGLAHGCGCGGAAERRAAALLRKPFGRVYATHPPTQPHSPRPLVIASALCFRRHQNSRMGAACCMKRHVFFYVCVRAHVVLFRRLQEAPRGLARIADTAHFRRHQRRKPRPDGLLFAADGPHVNESELRAACSTSRCRRHAPVLVGTSQSARAIRIASDSHMGGISTRRRAGCCVCTQTTCFAFLRIRRRPIQQQLAFKYGKVQPHVGDADALRS